MIHGWFTAVVHWLNIPGLNKHHGESNMKAVKRKETQNAMIFITNLTVIVVHRSWNRHKGSLCQAHRYQSRDLLSLPFFLKLPGPWVIWLNKSWWVCGGVVFQKGLSGPHRAAGKTWIIKFWTQETNKKKPWFYSHCFQMLLILNYCNPRRPWYIIL